MKAIHIADLKTNLSRYLRRVRRGERFVVLDRKEPVAEIIPSAPSGGTELDRLLREGRVRAPTRKLGALRFSRLGRSVGIQDLLDAVREDAR
jgi:prevent-host-death family protein